jgi:hypothetical protein
MKTKNRGDMIKVKVQRLCLQTSPTHKQIITLWAMSDGGVTNAGTHCARAGYGYAIRSNKPMKGWGNFNYTMSGKGRVEGNNLVMDSTRVEARGLLATMTRILSKFTRVISKVKTD